MCHRNSDLIETILGCRLEDFIDHADCGFRTLEAEAFLADVFGLQEGLEGLGLVEFGEDAQLCVVVGLLVWLFEGVLEPATLFRVLDVHVFDADGSAVGITEYPENFAKEHGASATKAARHEFAIEVPEGQPVALDFEVGVGALAIFEWVDIGHEVTAHSERIDQLLNPGGLVDVVSRIDGDVFRPVNRHVGDTE